MRRWLLLGAAVWGMALSLPVLAQQVATPSTSESPGVTSPVLTIDPERLFRESAFGKRVAVELEERGSELNAENRRIEAELEAEERELTEMRATLEPEAFRARADAFDRKVQDTRAAQSAKGREIANDLEGARESFLSAARPVLEQLMRDAGAAVIIERGLVFVSVSAVDVTDEAIAQIDERLGSGADNP